VVTDDGTSIDCNDSLGFQTDVLQPLHVSDLVRPNKQLLLPLYEHAAGMLIVGDASTSWHSVEDGPRT
jgi:hypothetical protein